MAALHRPAPPGAGEDAGRQSVGPPCASITAGPDLRPDVREASGLAARPRIPWWGEGADIGMQRQLRAGCRLCRSEAYGVGHAAGGTRFLGPGWRHVAVLTATTSACRGRVTQALTQGRSAWHPVCCSFRGEHNIRRHAFRRSERTCEASSEGISVGAMVEAARLRGVRLLRKDWRSSHAFLFAM